MKIIEQAPVNTAKHHNSVSASANSAPGASGRQITGPSHVENVSVDFGSIFARLSSDPFTSEGMKESFRSASILRTSHKVNPSQTQSKTTTRLPENGPSVEDESSGSISSVFTIFAKDPFGTEIETPTDSPEKETSGCGVGSAPSHTDPDGIGNGAGAKVRTLVKHFIAPEMPLKACRTLDAARGQMNKVINHGIEHEESTSRETVLAANPAGKATDPRRNNVPDHQPRVKGTDSRVSSNRKGAGKSNISIPGLKIKKFVKQKSTTDARLPVKGRPPIPMTPNTASVSGPTKGTPEQSERLAFAVQYCTNQLKRELTLLFDSTGTPRYAEPEFMAAVQKGRDSVANQFNVGLLEIVPDPSHASSGVVADIVEAFHGSCEKLCNAAKTRFTLSHELHDAALVARLAAKKPGKDESAARATDGGIKIPDGSVFVLKNGQPRTDVYAAGRVRDLSIPIKQHFDGQIESLKGACAEKGSSLENFRAAAAMLRTEAREALVAALHAEFSKYAPTILAGFHERLNEDFKEHVVDYAGMIKSARQPLVQASSKVLPIEAARLAAHQRARARVKAFDDLRGEVGDQQAIDQFRDEVAAREPNYLPPLTRSVGTMTDPVVDSRSRKKGVVARIFDRLMKSAGEAGKKRFMR